MQPSNTKTDDELIEHAIRAASDVRGHAYAPYSNFFVGACIVTADGHTYIGCNVENASYGLTQCAERSAVTAATAGGSRNVILCVIVTDAAQPTAPCGACRQVLYECNPTMTVVSRTTAGMEQRWVLRDLLPAAFDADTMSGQS